MVLAILNFANVEILSITVEEKASACNLTKVESSSVEVVGFWEEVTTYAIHFILEPVSVIEISV